MNCDTTSANVSISTRIESAYSKRSKNTFSVTNDDLQDTFKDEPSNQTQVLLVLNPNKEVFFMECMEHGDVTSFNSDFRWALWKLVIESVRYVASTVLEWNAVLYRNRPKLSGGCDTCCGLIDITNLAVSTMRQSTLDG